MYKYTTQQLIYLTSLYLFRDNPLNPLRILKGKKYTSDNQQEEGVSGLVGDKCDDGVVIDGNIITATPNADIDFALEIAKYLRVFSDDADLRETINFFKYGKK